MDELRLLGRRSRGKPHPPVAAEGQIHGQGENVLHELLVDVEEAAELLVGDAESQQHSDGHAKCQLLSLVVNVDGLGAAAPGPQSVLDHQLDFGQVTLQSFVAENLGENLRENEQGEVCARPRRSRVAPRSSRSCHRS